MEIKYNFKKRRDCRIFAMQYVCAALILKEETSTYLKNLFEISQFHYSNTYAEELLKQTLKNKNNLINEINKYVKESWTFDRLHSHDKAILLVSTYELLHKDIPHSIVINEALEIAKMFSYEKSKKYIHAILDKVAKSK